jgi:hypothetical protein
MGPRRKKTKRKKKKKRKRKKKRKKKKKKKKTTWKKRTKVDVGKDTTFPAVTSAKTENLLAPYRRSQG